MVSNYSRNQRALQRGQQIRDYSEHPDYWRDDDDNEDIEEGGE